ncbi:C40 family peptidase [Caldimonas brevitalea]|uniref:NlpC/P60 domain-containing protein n=1 Tax=Caldimonas brevitalea TaxID=413882 RepID=A0A0G3BQX3_9BURK|nr:hypothetical protein AAW51_2264 [Caldimonas brevitalea]
MSQHLLLARVRWALSALALASAPVLAAPDTPDTVHQFLNERGLVQPTSFGSAQPALPAGAAPGEKKGLMAHMRDAASEMVMTSMNFLGVPYRLGGNSAEEGFDCSGFTRYIFEHSLGLVLPRRAEEQAKAPGLIAVKREDLKPGDLVFFNTLRRTFSHVGIYIGEGKFIHSPRSGSEVRIEDMRIKYWTKRFTGARRSPVLEAAGTPVQGAEALSGLRNSLRAGGEPETPQATLSSSHYSP